MTQPFKIYEDGNFYHQKPDRKPRNGLKYLSCRAEKSSLTRSKIRGLVVNNSEITNVTCSGTSFEHFIVDGDSTIGFSHFTDVKFCHSGAVIDTAFKGNIFNSVLFHNVQFVNASFMRNAFINCVFSHCAFNDSTFNVNSFSGTVFSRNAIRNNRHQTDSATFMTKCDFKPATVIGPWEEYRDSYPQLKNYIVRRNLRVINTGFLTKDCVGLTGLERTSQIPKGFTSVDFDYSTTIAMPSASTCGSKIGTKTTQPITVPALPKHKLKPCRFMSAGL